MLQRNLGGNNPLNIIHKETGQKHRSVGRPSALLYTCFCSKPVSVLTRVFLGKFSTEIDLPRSRSLSY